MLYAVHTLTATSTQSRTDVDLMDRKRREIAFCNRSGDQAYCNRGWCCECECAALSRLWIMLSTRYIFISISFCLIYCTRATAKFSYFDTDRLASNCRHAYAGVQWTFVSLSVALQHSFGVPHDIPHSHIPQVRTAQTGGWWSRSYHPLSALSQAAPCVSVTSTLRQATASSSKSQWISNGSIHFHRLHPTARLPIAIRNVLLENFQTGSTQSPK